MSRQPESDGVPLINGERRALQVLANCIGELLGTRTEAYRNLLRASTSDNPLDLRLARLSFDALDAGMRDEIWLRVQAAGRRPADPARSRGRGAEHPGMGPDLSGEPAR